MSMGSGTQILLAELIMILVVLIVFWIVIVFIRSNAELRYLRDALRDADSAGERRYWRRQLRCRYLRLLPFVGPRNAERITAFFFTAQETAERFIFVCGCTQTVRSSG